MEVDHFAMGLTSAQNNFIMMAEFVLQLLHQIGLHEMDKFFPAQFNLQILKSLTISLRIKHERIILPICEMNQSVKFVIVASQVGNFELRIVVAVVILNERCNIGAMPVIDGELIGEHVSEWTVQVLTEHSNAQSQYQVQSCFLLDVVVREQFVIFELHSRVYHSLLLNGNPFLIHDSLLQLDD